MVILICCLSVFGQTTIYWNVSDSILQFYDAPSDNAKVLFTHKKVNVLDVYEIKKGWAKIKTADSVAYIRDNCVGDYEEYKKVRAFMYHKLVKESSWHLILIGASTLILLVYFIISFFDFRLHKLFIFIYCIASIILSILWITYLCKYHIELFNFTKFLFKEYFLYFFLTIILAPLVQVISFFKLKSFAIENCKSPYDIKLGVGSMIVGFILIFILEICEVSNYWLLSLWVITELCQLIQSWIIIKAIKDKKGVFYSVLIALAYFIGVHSAVIATSIILIVTLLILMCYFGFKFGIKLSLSMARGMLEAPPRNPYDNNYY